MRRVLFLVKKEFIQLVRDWRTLSLSLLLPVVVLFLFGYAITLDIKQVPLAVVDYSKCRASRDLVRRLAASNYFRAREVGFSEAASLLERGSVKMAMVIPPDFGKRTGARAPAAVQLLLDGSDNNASNIALGYALAILQDSAFELSLRPLIKTGITSENALPPLRLEPRLRFNPELSSTTFLVPGLVALIMMVTLVVLSSLSIVKERELGTLETIMVSPLSRSQFIMGKLAPYFVLGFADLFLILSAGRIFFQVPFRGSLLLLVGLSVVFIIGGLGMGLFFSTVAQTQRTAWMLSLLSTLLPSIILSGFIFPIRMMPKWLQVVTYAVPVRYYLVVVRGIALKAAGILDLWPQALALVIFAALMVSLAIFRFHKSLS